MSLTMAKQHGARTRRAVRRQDIQGLRAVAVLLVMAFHAGVPFVTGGYVGVDVFFVISGYLITGLIVHEVETTGRFDLRNFYARRVRRLLPGAALVMVAVGILTVTVLPVTRWETIGVDLLGASLYVVNWMLAGRSVDYLAQETAASPLQHFWSLAVEEQFYIVWPLLIVVLIGLARLRDGEIVTSRRTHVPTDTVPISLTRIAQSVSSDRTRLTSTGVVRQPRSARRPARPALSLFRGWLFGVLGVLVLLSFGWSLYLTAANSGVAYFATTTRAWELGVGALLAVVAERLPSNTRLKTLVGWVGFAAVALAAVIYTPQTAFPGAAALLPVLGAAAVLWAGSGAEFDSESGQGQVRFLKVPFLQQTGELSYSLYLWHWPLLVVAISVWGGPEQELWGPLPALVVILSTVPAWLAYRLVEHPLHTAAVLTRPLRALTAGIVSLLLGLGASAMVQWAQLRTETVNQTATGRGVDGRSQLAPGTQDSAFGAAALGQDPSQSEAGVPVNHVSAFVPALTQVADDNPDPYADGCHQDQNSPEVLHCSYGDLQSDTVVALVGDSHAAQWQPALRTLAEDNGWRLDTYTKSACPLADTTVWRSEKDEAYRSCTQWNAALLKRLTLQKPDLVITSMSGEYRVNDDGQPLSVATSQIPLGQAIARSWSTLNDAGIEVVALADNPRASFNIPECVANHTTELTRCVTDRDRGVERSGLPVQELALAAEPRTVMVNVNDWICPTQDCAAVIGGVLVMRDSHHLSATYAQTLAPMLGEQLSRTVLGPQV